VDHYTTATKRARINPPPSIDRLGKQVISDDKLLHNRSLLDLLLQRRGKGNLTDLAHISHPARHLVSRLGKSGFPVTLTTPPWTLQQRDDAIQRGPHPSSHTYVDFLREELADMVERATWLVLPYSRVRELRDLRLSPMGVVPQHARRPRPIVDYTYSGINRDTLPLAPREAMQFGRTLERLIAQVVHSNPRYGPVQFIKIDIADGFYRVWLRLEDSFKLAVTIPSHPHEPDLVAIPLSLPMGWTQSPPVFCAVTETIADIANRRLHTRFPSKPHRLDILADSAPQSSSPLASSAVLTPTFLSTPLPPPCPLLSSHKRPLQIVDVFVDDFIGAAQGGRRRLQHVRRTLMATIDHIFRPLQADDPPARTEPISLKKLADGDASWATCKQILGWVIDSVAMTLTLPPRRLQRLAEILAAVRPSQKRLAVDTWHQLLGELRSMSLAIPGARGLFSHLQAAIRTRHKNRLRLSPSFHQALTDFRWLYTNLSSRPTRLQELVPTTPCLIGAHDASALGAGGVWLPQPTARPRPVKLHLLEPDGHFHRVTHRSSGPIVWRASFPADIRNDIATAHHPQGPINNSELELLGGLWHDDVAAQCFDVRERTTKSHTDNIAALYWSRKGSVTTTSPTATILRQQALHRRFHRMVSLKDYIPGDANCLADDASRLFHLADDKFLSHFNVHHPQAQPWRLFPLHPQIHSSGISALRKRMSPTASFLHAPKLPRHTGPTGRPSVPTYSWILPFATSRTPSQSYKSSHTDTAMVLSTPAGALSAAAPWKVPYGALAKRWPVWGPRTPGSQPKVLLTSG
jgi:hypothetical protein